jgi:hypothetical protein
MTGSRCAASPPGRIPSPKQLCAEASRCRPSPGSHTKIILVRRMVNMVKYRLTVKLPVAGLQIKGPIRRALVYSERVGERSRTSISK